MYTSYLRNTSCVAAMACALVLLPDAALAQAADDGANAPIIVTAQRRQEAQVDVPITVTTLDSEALQTANVQDLSDIAKITPALRFDTTGSFAQPNIRGIGTSITTSGGGANVGIYLDGFYSPNPLASDMQLMKVQSVQVLKGPQGTLFGRNTTGGAILIQSADPSEDTTLEGRVSYGRFNELRAQAYASTGLAEGVAIDIEGMYRRGDGFHTNIIDGNDETGKFRSWSVRTGLKLEFGPASLLVRYQHGDIDDPTPLMSATYVDPVFGAMAPSFVPASFITTRPNEVAFDRPTFFESKTDVLQATFKVDMGFADLTSYSQFRAEDVDQSQNLDNTGLTIFQLGLPVKNETMSQELLLNSKPGGALQWTAGLFWFSNRDTYLTFSDGASAARDLLGPNRLGGSSTTTQSYAAFLDGTYELTPQLFITAGLRYAHDRVDNAYYNPGPPRISVPSISGEKLTPRFVVRYKPTPDTSVYASYTQGYKAAILDVGGTCQNPVNIPTPSNPTGAGFTCNDVRPEKIDAWEVGFKLDDRRLSFETSAFYYDYKNLQVSLFLDGRANIINAATSEIYGIDGAIRYELFDGFELNAGGSWTHARYKDFPIAPIYAPDPLTGLFAVALTPLKNVTMQRVPEFTGNIGASYKAPVGGGELALSGNLYLTSKVHFGPSGIQFPQEGYEVASARAQWTDPSDRFTIAVWGDNLTNNRYITAVQYNTIGLGANWSAPTTYGIELGFKY